MKYIRTKDRVFETNRLPIERFSIELTKIIDKQIGLPNPHIEEIEIIKQADTIEELCDEAVFFDKDNKPHYKSQEGNIWYLGASLFTETLRLCIFTDKGLIYVAKLNDKGELELL